MSRIPFVVPDAPLGAGFATFGVPTQQVVAAHAAVSETPQCYEGMNSK
jgi:hypothetical protein